MDYQNSKRIPKITFFCFSDYAKAFVCVDHNKMWKILKEMGIQDHLNCLFRNLYASQEAAVRTGLLSSGLGKNLECPLDCKEMQPVHPKGNQS